MAVRNVKLIGLIGHPIGAITKPRDLVVDRAAGRLVATQAVHQLGREFVGCDIVYHALSRLAFEQRRPKMDEASKEVFSPGRRIPSYDSKHALGLAHYLRTIGYNVWIEMQLSASHQAAVLIDEPGRTVPMLALVQIRFVLQVSVMASSSAVASPVEVRLKAMQLTSYCCSIDFARTPEASGIYQLQTILLKTGSV